MDGEAAVVAGHQRLEVGEQRRVGAQRVALVLERAAANQFPQGVVLQLIWLGALQNLTILVPVGLLLGV
ncbi:MAG TPA: hypothetical protein VHE35_30010, partial [Kofleriaceae bacterium]|nr:hypothetical protein [Kofleriaceae bacterium]